MSEIAFGGGPCQIELGDRRPHGLERGSQLFDAGLVLVGAHAQRRHGVVGIAHIPAQTVEGQHIRVERDPAGGN